MIFRSDNVIETVTGIGQFGRGVGGKLTCTRQQDDSANLKM